MSPSRRGVVGVSSENDDCTVRAVVNSTGFNYDTVHTMLKKHGREECKGAFYPTIIEAYLELGLSLVGVFGVTRAASEMFRVARAYRLNPTQYPGVSLKTFLALYPRGSFVCLNKNHAFSIVDGKLIDLTPLPARTYVTAVFSKTKIGSKIEA